jgi:hypothetical protein
MHEDQGPMPQGDYDRLEADRDHWKKRCLALEDQGNPNIQVEVTDARELHCFRLLLNPKSAPAGEVSSCCGVPVLRTPDGFLCTMCTQQCDVVMAGSGRIEVMLHARSLVDLVHKCSTALCSWQKQTTDYLLEKVVMEAAATSLNDP